MRRKPYMLAVSAAVVACLLSLTGLAQQTTPNQFGLKGGSVVVGNGGAAVRVSEAAPAFVIGPEDLLTISVWKEADLSKDVAVRSDGKISIPLVGELLAAGRTTEELQKELTKRLQDYIAVPAVTVIVKEIRSRTFNILGEVARPGSYSLAKPTTVVDAIAQAGGLREWARFKSIYVLRRAPDGATLRIPFNYKKAILGNGGDFDLRSKDTIVVP